MGGVSSVKHFHTEHSWCIIRQAPIKNNFFENVPRCTTHCNIIHSTVYYTASFPSVLKGDVWEASWILAAATELGTMKTGCIMGRLWPSHSSSNRLMPRSLPLCPLPPRLISVGHPAGTVPLSSSLCCDPCWHDRWAFWDQMSSHRIYGLRNVVC